MLSATQHLVCSAERPASSAAFDPKWRTETALALGRGIVANWAFDRLLVLADALEEAGCDAPMILRHCRECHHHTAVCWVLGDLFARPPVARPVQLTDEQVRREVERVTGRRLDSDDQPVDGFRTAFGLSSKWVLVLVGVVLLLRYFPSIIPRPSPMPPASLTPRPPATPFDANRR